MNPNPFVCYNKIQSVLFTQLSTEYTLISAGEHHNQFSCISYHEKWYVTLWHHYDINLARKNWKHLFSWTACMFPPENGYKSLLPRNAHATYKVACTIVILAGFVTICPLWYGQISVDKSCKSPLWWTFQFAGWYPYQSQYQGQRVIFNPQHFGFSLITKTRPN